MTHLLLDTHVLLWFLAEKDKLPAGWEAAITDPAADVFLSVGAVWEAVIKYQSGKLPLSEPPEVLLPRECVRQRIDILPIDLETVRALAGLPPLHRDPFDRIIVSHALQYDLTLMTVDAAVRAYPVKLLAP